jgi:membrane protein
VQLRKRALVAKFFADRGTHLAAMIAYFALLSFVPLTFLALAVLGVGGRANESSFVVTEIKRTFPDAPIDDIVGLVRTVQDNAATLAGIGGAFLLWTSLSLFSVLESAFNIVYGRPNRSFLRGKALASLLVLASLVTLFVGLLAGSLGFAAGKRYFPGFFDNGVVAYALTVAVSTAGVLAFVVVTYYLLTNEDLRVHEVLPGAVFATAGIEAAFQTLPVYIRYASVNPALHIFGGTAILLVWLYVMANVLVFGAELNWWLRERRGGDRPPPALGAS